MRPVWLVVAGVALAASAWAQNAPIQATPLPPLQQQEGLPPVPRLLVLPGVPAPSAQGQVPAAPPLMPPAAPSVISPAAPSVTSPAAPPVTPPAVMERPNVWLPASAAKLEALDKVNAQATVLTIKVGQSATFGSLTITVKACVIRPADQPADAAAYLDVTDSHPDTPGFHGWMLGNEPSVSMMQHPIYDIRVAGCG